MGVLGGFYVGALIGSYENDDDLDFLSTGVADAAIGEGRTGNRRLHGLSTLVTGSLSCRDADYIAPHTLRGKKGDAGYSEAPRPMDNSYCAPGCSPGRNERTDPASYTRA